MLTIKKLEEMEPGIFASGVTTDSPEGVNMSNSGQKLGWVAVRGDGYHDWAVYVHPGCPPQNWIKDHGDKVNFKDNIKKLVPCDDEAYKMYRR